MECGGREIQGESNLELFTVVFSGIGVDEFATQRPLF